MRKTAVKYIGFFLLLTVFFANCKKKENETTEIIKTTPFSGAALDTFRIKCLNEINFARTTPAAYAEARLKADYNAGSDNGSYLDIKSRAAVDSLKLQSQLNTSANKYAAVLNDHKSLSHTYNNTDPSTRAKAEGYNYCMGENLDLGADPNFYDINSYPATAAIQTIRDFIIDEGVEGLGHRNNVMSDTFKKLGLGYYGSGSYFFFVQDFGSN